ncbi:hypothetical protein FJT64_021052 [Amphibalanus amphitrite]|uniref:Uncharacterized protein n=1 Tax=Amphibalanus amphitrite TaxID=1232801 RepID=A0A6A4WJR8_AMPAM|nr:hypothetical protein FJT64_021052 [Amphibalanus amphitrite]
MWNESKSLLEVLQQPYVVTIRFQSATVTPGAFMKEWVMLKSHLNAKGDVGTGIASSMQQDHKPSTSSAHRRAKRKMKKNADKRDETKKLEVGDLSSGPG